jgi:DNA-nicking Smr family endonuclease
MAKKKKRKTDPQNQSSNQPKALNTPFSGLKQALRQADLPDSQPSEVKRIPVQNPPESENDEQAFHRAMSDVKPLPPKERARINHKPQAKQPLLNQEVDEDLEVMAQLADLISGNAEMDLRYSDEFVWGAAPGIGPDLMDRLAAGAFPIQDYLDLHGFSQEDAMQQVEQFLVGSATKSLRHVLIVHGRGAGSPGGVPVLKRTLTQALNHKRLRKRVLAFCTALQRDGGIGAIYVLLRKWQGPGRWG